MKFPTTTSSEELRHALRSQLAFARMQTDRLFEMLAPAAIHERPIPERHRIVFYLGHFEAFDWNMVGQTLFGARSFNSEFDRLFAFGIDPIDGQLPQDRPEDWPSVDEIRSYNQRVRRAVDECLEKATFADSREPFGENGLMFRVGIEHRLMHAETLSYMLHWLPYHLKRGTGDINAINNNKDGEPREPRMAEIPAGPAILGQARGEGSFGWDNEFESHRVFVPEFSIEAFNVTNGQFVEFVQAGGYQERSFWSDEGWQWLQSSGIRHPKFWIQRGDHWLLRTMFDEIPLPMSWPVYVSHAEANAYARHAGKSLPTEAQYHRAAFNSGDAGRPSGNFDFRSWTPHPVGSIPESRSAFGVYDLVGNGWEWTSTTFAPFPGFQPFSFYPGYSADFFDGRHFVLKGASPRTAALLVRQSFRNWFQPHYPNVYATFRCVKK
ncbi:MAG TPA: SUMF1/EgtB/PvdO family nonheme iron enzyme [Terriglobia bacterium]|nr:SUMF1/EgtB/PvdO family nonheme iron enzyme [Terriglobia bacterium]